MKYRQVAPGLYKDANGRWYERPTLKGKRTWRRLYSLTLADAKKEVAVKRSAHHRAPLGLARDPYRPQPKIAAILDAYQAAGCPTPRGLPRAARTQLDESRRLDRLREAFGTMNVQDVTFDRARAFGLELNAPRSADLHLYTLRNALRFALEHGRLDQNPLAQFPRFRSPRQVRHCRDSAPASGEEFHQIAAWLFQRPVTEPLAWQWLLQGLTGGRTSEILALRMDATRAETPGFIEGDWLWLERRKGGVNPFALITPELRAAIVAHQAWHRERFPQHPHWIPHRLDRQAPANADALNHALNRATAALQLPHRHAHGLRAFFVTVRRSQGASDAQIAAEIGDTTGAAIIASTYGAVPPNWKGRAGLTFLPASGLPAWHPWTPQSGSQSGTLPPGGPPGLPNQNQAAVPG